MKSFKEKDKLTRISDNKNGVVKGIYNNNILVLFDDLSYNVYSINTNEFVYSTIKKENKLATDDSNKTPIQIKAKIIANYIINDITGWCKKANIDVNDSNITAEYLAEIAEMVYNNEITKKQGKDLLKLAFDLKHDVSEEFTKKITKIVEVLKVNKQDAGSHS